MKYVISKKTGKRLCLHCKLYECICLPESGEYTELEIKGQFDFPSNKATKFIFYKQKLPNGRIIKSNSELDVPYFKWSRGPYKGRKTILLSNDIINKAFCD